MSTADDDYTLDRLVADIDGLLAAGLSEYGLIEGIGRKLKKAVRNPEFLTPAQRTPDAEHYARHYLHRDADERFVVMALVWSPGQGTPVHDHGTWGVIGVYAGEIEAVNFKRLDDGRDAGYADVRETGRMFLTPGALCWVLPPNEEIHINRNATDAITVTLHVYGKVIQGFHVFDVPAKTVHWVDLPPHP